VRGAASLCPAILVFLLGSIPRAQAPSPETTVPAPPVEPAVPSTSQPQLPYGVIVIDPGHGGEDVGTRGAAGTEEKALTLAIAQRVKTLLETRLGTRVVLTRSDDRRVGFDERAAIANNSRAGLFLSLHLNSSPNPASAGAEVIHLRQGRIAGGRGRAGDEAVALPAPGGTSRTVELIRWETAQARHLNASAAFAETLEAQLRTRVTMSSRPALDLPLRVLPSVNMPAVVLEVAYLSNAGDEGLAQSSAFQDNIALAIHDTVVQFSSYVEEQEGR
jgi:N-acetylmuramoyl-L-alanine amidase